MTILNQLASQLNRKDEEPNIELAQALVREQDTESIQELMHLLSTEKKAIQNDCIKVAYEMGRLHPTSISPYALTFIDFLTSRNNRLVWGSMQALSTIAYDVPEVLLDNLPTIQAAIQNGSVITVDKGILTLAKVASVNETYNLSIFPFLVKHLQTCRPKEVPQHAESTLLAVTPDNQASFLAVLQEREPYLSNAQSKRVQKIYKQLNV